MILFQQLLRPHRDNDTNRDVLLISPSYYVLSHDNIRYTYTCFFVVRIE